MLKTNPYISILTDQEFQYYKDAGIPKERRVFNIKRLMKDLKADKLTASAAYLLITDQYSTDELPDLTDKLADEIDFLCGEDDPVIELWSSLDSLIGN